MRPSRLLLALTVASCLLQPWAAGALAAEDSDKSPNSAPGSKRNETDTPAGGNRKSAKTGKAGTQPAADAIPGYTIQKIQGFNVIINNSVLGQDVSKFERKPLDVLDLELGTIVNLMPPNATEALRKLLIWVEWDEETELSNGRSGKAAAVYYGGHQLQLLKGGKHPLKAKSITVLSMLELTKEHQPDRDSGRCVLLHEMAHAVHNELLGRQSEPVQAAYYQAMQRNLYEKHLYAATNEQEFFAETTCAYFDQLHYYPKTRADLEKHDPVTFRLMQEVWGKRPIAKTSLAKSTNGKPDTKPSDSEPAKPGIKLADIDLGKAISGPAVTQSDLESRPVLLVLWNSGNGSSLTCLSKLQTWDDELRNFGLVTVAEHLTGQQTTDFAKAVSSRNISFAVTEAKWTNRSLVKNFTDFPLCLVFDHAGECVYQGSPFEAENAVRKAVGGALASSLEGELPKPLAVIADALRGGTPPQSLLVKIAMLAKSKTAPGHEQAAKLLEQMSENGRLQLEEARGLIDAEPVKAFVALEKVAAAYKGTPLGVEALQAVGKLRSLKPVQEEIKARAGLLAVKKLDTELSSRPGAFDPTQEKFRFQNSALIAELQKAVLQMVKTWPRALATQEALAIGRKYMEGE